MVEEISRREEDLERFQGGKLRFSLFSLYEIWPI